MNRDKAKAFGLLAGCMLVMLVLGLVLRYGKEQKTEEIPHLHIFYEKGDPQRPVVTVIVGDRIIRLKQEGEP